MEGGGVFLFFSVWGGGGGGACFVFLLFGRVSFFFLLFGRGTGVHSLTGLPGSSLSDPTTKKPNSKKNTGSPPQIRGRLFGIPTTILVYTLGSILRPALSM